MRVKSILATSLAALFASYGALALPSDPATGISSDDFNTALLDTGTWNFVDPLGDVAFGLTGAGTDDAYFRMEMTGGASRDLWEDGLFAPRLMQSANDTDFEIETKFDSVPTERFHFQGMLAQAAGDHVVRVEFLSRGSSKYLFAAAINGSQAQVFADIKQANDLVPNRLRLGRVGDDWTVSTSFDGVDWTVQATFAHVIEISQVGVHAGTVDLDGDPAPDFTCLVDYFLNLAAPFGVEDGPLDTDPPVANAGMSVQAHPGDVVVFDGSASSDDSTDTEDLVYDWSLIEQPVGSLAVLLDASSGAPSLEVDALGDYVLQLIVTDLAGLSSEPSTVLVSSLNQPPIADAGDEQTIEIGDVALLDGLDSYDPDGDALTYQWTLLSAPAGSTSTLVGAAGATPSLTLDVDGDYEVQLVVSDPYSDSEPVVVMLHATDPAVSARQLLRDAAKKLRYSSSGDFAHRFYRRFMLYQVRRAASNVRCGQVEFAKWRLKYLLARTDGCTERGNPDPRCAQPQNRPDWVTDCGLQDDLYDCLTAALNALD